AGTGRADQRAGGVHHRGGRRAADAGDEGKRDAERGAGGGEAGRAGGVRRGRAAAFRRGEPDAVHAERFRQIGVARRRGARRDGGGGDHLLRLLRLRCDIDRGGGDEEPRPRPGDRDRRVDDRVRGDLHGRRDHGGRRAALHRLCRQPGAAGADPARDRAAGLRDLPGGQRGDRAADGAAGLPVRAEPHLLRDGARRAAARLAGE
ncbi:hypothetical protein LTR94_030480, partial [Friedmanniomyces endolithicus]